MRAFVTEHAGGRLVSERRFVVVCCQRFALGTEEATRIEEPIAEHHLAGALGELLVAPEKREADVVLAAPAGEAAVWLSHPERKAPVSIEAPAWDPADPIRLGQLLDPVARAFVVAGGLRVGRRDADAPAILEWPGEMPAQFFQVAPMRQRFPRLTGREGIWLRNRSVRTTSKLPAGWVRVTATDAGSTEIVKMALDTLVIDAASREAIAFYRGSLRRAAHAPVPQVTAAWCGVSSASENPGMTVAARPPSPSPPEPVSPPPRRTAPLDEVALAHALATLPFRADLAESLGPPPQVASTDEHRARPQWEEPTQSVRSPAAPHPLGRASGADAPAQEGLPFVAHQSAAPSSRLPIEECAALDAASQAKAADRTERLSAKQMTAQSLREQITAWRASIVEEGKIGKRDLQRRYDEAFLGELEAIRGRSISNDEYARLTVAVERSNAAAVLGELGLPAGSLLVISRAFSDRAASSPELRREIRNLVAAARERE